MNKCIDKYASSAQKSPNTDPKKPNSVGNVKRSQGPSAPVKPNASVGRQSRKR